jgi:hypothetical protein
VKSRSSTRLIRVRRMSALLAGSMAYETSTSVLAALLSKHLLSTSPASRARKH